MNNIFVNHEETDSYEYDLKQTGGGFDYKNTPHGGFLPIKVCEKIIEKAETEKSEPKREYEADNKTISIKSILERRRKVPFGK